jgi:hypothetical protein
VALAETSFSGKSKLPACVDFKYVIDSFLAIGVISFVQDDTWNSEFATALASQCDAHWDSQLNHKTHPDVVVDRLCNSDLVLLCFVMEHTSDVEEGTPPLLQRMMDLAQCKQKVAVVRFDGEGDVSEGWTGVYCRGRCDGKINAEEVFAAIEQNMPAYNTSLPSNIPAPPIGNGHTQTPPNTSPLPTIAQATSTTDDRTLPTPAIHIANGSSAQAAATTEHRTSSMTPPITLADLASQSSPGILHTSVEAQNVRGRTASPRSFSRGSWSEKEMVDARRSKSVPVRKKKWWWVTPKKEKTSEAVSGIARDVKDIKELLTEGHKVRNDSNKEILEGTLSTKTMVQDVRAGVSLLGK